MDERTSVRANERTNERRQRQKLLQRRKKRRKKKARDSRRRSLLRTRTLRGSAGVVLVPSSHWPIPKRTNKREIEYCPLFLSFYLCILQRGIR